MAASSAAVPRVLISRDDDGWSTYQCADCAAGTIGEEPDGAYSDGLACDRCGVLLCDGCASEARGCVWRHCASPTACGTFCPRCAVSLAPHDDATCDHCVRAHVEREERRLAKQRAARAARAPEAPAVVWQRMLCAIHGVSARRADAIVRQYPSAAELFAAYRIARDSGADLDAMLCNVAVGTARIGPALSRTIRQALVPDPRQL